MSGDGSGADGANDWYADSEYEWPEEQQARLEKEKQEQEQDMPDELRPETPNGEEQAHLMDQDRLNGVSAVGCGEGGEGHEIDEESPVQRGKGTKKNVVREPDTSSDSDSDSGGGGGGADENGGGDVAPRRSRQPPPVSRQLGDGAWQSAGAQCAGAQAKRAKIRKQAIGPKTTEWMNLMIKTVMEMFVDKKGAKLDASSLDAEMDGCAEVVVKNAVANEREQTELEAADVLSAFNGICCGVSLRDACVAVNDILGGLIPGSTAGSRSATVLKKICEGDVENRASARREYSDLVKELQAHWAHVVPSAPEKFVSAHAKFLRVGNMSGDVTATQASLCGDDDSAGKLPGRDGVMVTSLLSPMTATCAGLERLHGPEPLATTFDIVRTNGTMDRSPVPGGPLFFFRLVCGEHDEHNDGSAAVVLQRLASCRDMDLLKTVPPAADPRAASVATAAAATLEAATAAAATAGDLHFADAVRVAAALDKVREDAGCWGQHCAVHDYDVYLHWPSLQCKAVAAASELATDAENAAVSPWDVGGVYNNGNFLFRGFEYAPSTDMASVLSSSRCIVDVKAKETGKVVDRVELRFGVAAVAEDTAHADNAPRQPIITVSNGDDRQARATVRPTSIADLASFRRVVDLLSYGSRELATSRWEYGNPVRRGTRSLTTRAQQTRHAFVLLSQLRARHRIASTGL